MGFCSSLIPIRWEFLDYTPSVGLVPQPNLTSVRVGPSFLCADSSPHSQCRPKLREGGHRCGTVKAVALLGPLSWLHVPGISWGGGGGVGRDEGPRMSEVLPPFLRTCCPVAGRGIEARC